MEIAGIKIDIKKMKELSKEFENHSKELMKQIYAIAGEEFNIASPKQLGYILFEKLGYGGAKKSKKTGNYSTNVEILEDLANQGYEICQKILMWRHYTKLKNTYTDTLPQMVDKNNRIHTTYSNTLVPFLYLYRYFLVYNLIWYLLILKYVFCFSEVLCIVQPYL